MIIELFFMEPKSYSQVIWDLVGDFILDTHNLISKYDSQLVLTRKRFLDYTLLKVHYTKHIYKEYIIIKTEEIEVAASQIYSDLLLYP